MGCIKIRLGSIIDLAGIEQIFTFVCIFNVLGFTAPLFNDAPPLSRFAFLFLLQFLSGFLTQQQLLQYRRIQYLCNSRKSKYMDSITIIYPSKFIQSTIVITEMSCQYWKWYLCMELVFSSWYYCRKIKCHLPWASSSSQVSWNPSSPSWLWRPPPYACAPQRACGRCRPVWPSSPGDSGHW